MLDFIPYLLIIPIAYNMIYFLQSMGKLATKYKDPNDMKRVLLGV